MARERKNWTSREDELLEKAVERARSNLQPLQWNVVATSVPGRTNKDCRKRYYYKISATVNKGIWTKPEDDRLREAVHKYGVKWSRVAAEVGTRSGDQCSKRWNNTLDPGIDQSPWSRRDTDTLLRWVEKEGHNWQSIVNDHFPGRTALSARNHYNYMCRRSGTSSQPSTPSSDPSSGSSRHRNGSRVQSRKTSIGLRRSKPKETNVESDMGESDFDNYSLSDEDECEEWPMDFATGQQDHATDDSHVVSTAFSFESNTAPLMEMDISGTLTTSSYGSDQYQSLDHLFPSQPIPGVADSQMFLQSPSSEDATTNVRPTLAPSQHSYFGSAAMKYSDTPTVNVAEISPMETVENDRNVKKSVTITATCSRAELRRLMQSTTDELQYIDFSVTSREPHAPAVGPGTGPDGTKLIVITASCPAHEVGRLMEMASDTLGSVSFSVCPSHNQAG